jgi:hypothetical protein
MARLAALPQRIWHRAWIVFADVPHQPASTAAERLEVDRKCVVCEWTGTLQEAADTPEIDGQCPACHAPTERVRVRREWEHVPNEHAAALGRLGGLKGGPARAAALSPKRRREIARAAAAARWKRR